MNYCTHCGKELNYGEKYCPYCGCKCGNESLNNQNISSTNSPLILGIFALVFSMIPIISIPLAIISIILAIKSKEKSKAGLILSIISIIISTLLIVAITFIVTYIINHGNDYLEQNPLEEFFHDYLNEEWFEENQSFDIRGYSWQAEDDSTLYLNMNNTYIWYQKDDNHTDNYYEGDFKVYTGEDAIQYITQFYEMPKENQEKTFENYGINNYYLLILNCKKTKMNGTESNGTSNIAYYSGFYSKSEEKLELTNILTSNKSGFTLKDKLQNIDV